MPGRGQLHATIAEYDSLAFEARAELAMRGFIASRRQKRADREAVEGLLRERLHGIEEDKASQISRLEIGHTFRTAAAVQEVVGKVKAAAQVRLKQLDGTPEYYAALRGIIKESVEVINDDCVIIARQCDVPQITAFLAEGKFKHSVTISSGETLPSDTMGVHLRSASGTVTIEESFAERIERAIKHCEPQLIGILVPPAAATAGKGFA